MSSTEQTEEDKRRWSTEMQQRQWAAKMAVLEGRAPGRASPEPAEPAEPPSGPGGGDVALHIGNTDLDSLDVIEDIPQHRRITITASRVSASVPNLMAPPHLLSRLNPSWVRFWLFEGICSC